MKRRAKLYPKIVTFENLLLAAKRATRGKKAKNSVISFDFNLENELILLKQQLETKSYRPRPYSQFEVKEPKVRKICSSDFRDRVVHHAICNFLEPIIERRSVFDSYACRNGKGAHLAVSRCQEFSRKFKYYLCIR
jgi:retron-type reverse transcriptase